MRVNSDTFGNTLGGIIFLIGLLVFLFTGDPDIHDAILKWLLTQSN